jgi:hypothetical protein
MLDRKQNIRIVNLDSIILIVILTLGLLIYHNSYSNHSDREKNSCKTEISIDQSCATIISVIRLQAFQKTWIYDKDFFNLLSFTKNQFIENKQVDQKISLLKNIRNSTERIPISFFQCHLFPTERDELPLLS